MNTLYIQPMKTIKEYVLPALLVMGSLAQVAAQTAIDAYFSEYAADPRFTSVSVSSKMFSLFSNIDVEDPDSKEVLEAMSGLKGIKILTAQDVGPRENFRAAVGKMGSAYEELMSVDKGDEQVRFYVLEKGDKIDELFMIVGSEGHLVLMSITGDIDLNKLSKLSKGMNIGGMDYLDSLDKNGKDEGK